MTRGDVVVVALSGDYGKPRPTLVVQSDRFVDHPSVTVLPITSHRVEAPLLRVDIGPECRIERPSQIQIDKAANASSRADRPGDWTVDEATLVAVKRVMTVFLGLV
jgi:mRNA interferase MazF